MIASNAPVRGILVEWDKQSGGTGWIRLIRQSKADRRRLTLTNGKSASFQVVPKYPFADIALVKIPAYDSLASMPIATNG